MKSASYKLWKAASRMSDDTTFDSYKMREQLGFEDDKASFSKALHTMKSHGALERVGRGLYKTTRKTKNWGETFNFRHKAVKQKKTPQAGKTLNPILNNLLDAMAEAESEIVRLTELDAKLKSIMDL